MAQWVQPPLPAELIARRGGPMVGRDAELAVFEQAWERVESGNRQAVFVGGEPGAGKTRLVAEVAGTLAEHGSRCWWAVRRPTRACRMRRSPRRWTVC
ncbi:AAA ATPase domain protein [Mycobacterium kansasii]|uniref:AAA ATPase domain protein n=1 Tax=Mycobacterium kansasii TaxID=1768 RepID=A0A1V3X3Z0_MYCKA|nr:AAA ATPase domain protein [Mycobacterium kansasii]